VAAYTGLITDQYPPFRLDTGGSEPTGTLTLPPKEPAGGGGAKDGSRSTRGWTAGPIVGVIIGSLMALTGVGLLGGGATSLWADRTERDADGYLSLPAQTFSTETHAIVAESIRVHAGGPKLELSRRHPR